MVVVVVAVAAVMLALLPLGIHNSGLSMTILLGSRYSQQDRKTTGEAPAPPTQPQAELPRPRAHLPPVTRQLEISKEQSEAPTERQSDNPAIGETTASSIQSTKTE